MATMKMTGCMKIVARMPQADQDAILARLDQYQADGIPAEQAQRMAANDMLEEIRAERTQIFDAIAEQFPDLLQAPAEEATLSRQRNADLSAAADEIAAMDPEVRDNTELGDFPGAAAGYDLYEARQLLKKPSDKLKRITENNSFSLWQSQDYIANVDGDLFGVTKQEDPDEPDDDTKFVYAFQRLDDPDQKLITTTTDQVDQLFAEMRASKGGAQLSRKRSFYRDLLPEAGYERITDQDSPKIYKDKSGNAYATFEKDGARAAFSSNNILYEDDRGRVAVGYGEENESVFRALIVDADKRQQGKGSAVMQDVIAAADAAGTVLYLEPAPIEGNKMSAKQLADFYKRFGFDQAQEGSDKVLVRQPAQATLSRQRNPQIDTPEFKRWFGDSQVVDENGEPLVMYHGTSKSFDQFNTKSRSILLGSGSYFTADPVEADNFTMSQWPALFGTTKPQIVPVYLSLKNPYVTDNKIDSKAREESIRENYDGIIVRGKDGRIEWAVAFEPTQIKSATGNQGTFDPNNPDITQSRRRNYGNLTADQEQALRNVGGIKPNQTVRERAQQLQTKFADTWVGGIFDQFAELRQLDPKAYILARLSKGTDGTLEALMLYGKPFLTKDGVADVDINDKGFAKVLGKLEGEQDRFLWWVAAQRAERLKAQGLENLFTDQDITSLKAFDQGNLPSGKPRGQAYAQALQEMNEFNDAVLEVAEKSGLIDPEARKLFKDTPYVPFYRVMEQEDGVAGPTFSSGLVNQYAWKKLKGGKQKLNDDLLANVLLNWSHLYAAAAKNRAASAALQAGVQAGVAEVVPSGTKGAVRVRENGKEVHYLVTDPGVMAAIGAIEYRTPGFFKPFSTMKRWLSIGVTANPTYKVKNLMRDSLSSIAVSDLSANALKNVGQGFKGTSKESQTFASMLAGGGLIRFGSMLDGDNAARTRKLIEKEGGQLLDEAGWKKLSTMLVDTWDAYNELGDRFENANRAALYEQLRAKGYSELDANFMSRDLMDFSMSGRWPVVRFLVETVPFMNARLQGLYKLGRGAKENPRKFGYTVGAVALASLALMLAYEDDDDWKKRPDWDRDANWWFKIGGMAFRIPKPFEVGAIGTIAERGWELAFNKEMTMRRFGQRMSNMIFDTFAMDPTPQIAKPLFDVYANKAGFSNLPIEGMGMRRLRPEDRADERTSYAARFLGGLGLPNPAGLARGEYDKLSPVQIDYLLKGYFGWLGTAATTVMDYGIRPMMNAGERPDMRLRDVFLAGNFVETLPSGSSRYVDQLYEQSRLIEEAYNSHRAAIKKGDIAGARKIMAEEGEKIRAYSRVNTISDRVGEINAKIRRIEASQSMSGETKRRMIDMLSEQKNRLAQNAQGALR